MLVNVATKLIEIVLAFVHCINFFGIFGDTGEQNIFYTKY